MSKKKIPNRALKLIRQFHPEILQVIDSNKSITVEVTEKDDKNSKLKNHGQCAMAVACKRQQHADAVIISVRTAYVIKGKTAYRYRVPESTAREVISFDRKGGFQPGTYSLKAPCVSEKLGCGKTGKNRNHSNRRPIRFSHRTTNIRTNLTKTL